MLPRRGLAVALWTIASLALAGCGGPRDGLGGLTVGEGWSEAEPGLFERPAGIDFDSLARGHAEGASFGLDLPGMGEVQVHAMPHARPYLDTWQRAKSGWEHGAYLQGLSWGHGHLHGYGFDGGGAGTGRDSSLELVAAPAGWEGVVGVVEDGRERLYRLWLEPGPDREPVQRVLVEATSCHRADDYTWIYGCGSRPVREGELAPL